MIAQENTTYAQIIDGKCHWIFTADDLPEWNEQDIDAVDVTGLVVNVGDLFDGATFTAPQPATLTNRISAAIKRIDRDVDDIYAAIIGNRASEYTLAESEADAYKAAGYPASPVPASVQSWSDAKGQTPTWAADDIVATAANWRTVQANVRTKRLATKESVRIAYDQTGIDSAMAAWETYVAVTRTALGI
jgi:hypothetical protein